MVESFTDYQRRMWKTLAHLGIFRYYIGVSSKGRYFIKRLHFLNEALFWVLWANTAFKFVYHILTYHGMLGVEVHFLDQMSIWDWILMYVHVFIECCVWFFKYPFWENLYRQWELQEEIYEKLGKPENAAKKITKTDSINFFVYGGVCIVGTLALVVQFFATPKYALNTYAIVPGDTLLLRIIFCAHECMFMAPGYAYQAFTMVLAESYSVSYQHLLEEMNKALRTLIHSESYFAKIQHVHKEDDSLQKISMSEVEDGAQESFPEKGLLEQQQLPPKPNRWVRLKIINPKTKARGTQYDIRTLIEDYRKVMISAQFHNQWVGGIMGFPECLNYAQFVSDVFMMIQLLKEEGDADYLSVFFYIMDASFGMVMLFRMLIILSRLVPQSETFLGGLKTYASLNTPIRKEILKILPTFKIISAKLTGYTVRPQSVPVGMHVLINWYICAAMWQRPTNRKT